jgi:hypothetical protein
MLVVKPFYLKITPTQMDLTWVVKTKLLSRWVVY